MKIAGREFKKTDYYVFKDNAMHRNVAAGLIRENRRPYRLAGNYNLYIDSFPTVALPYSTYYVADKNSGEVYSCEVLHNTSDNKRFIKELVEELKNRR